MYAHYPEKRYRLTLEFLKKHVNTDEQILDLGVPNPFSEIMTREGYTVQNTGGEDLDLELDHIRNSGATVVTAFEILEHLVAPFNVLRDIPADKILASIPLRLWFASAY
ncbi:MAG: methyltransferase, partial [Robiginitalea sp.]